jgi:4-nitrophenyl phosphatase
MTDSPGAGNVVLDLDGCLYVGDRPVPGAREALEGLAAAGMRIVYATNNSTKTPGVVAERIRAIVGLAVDPATVVTSAMAAVSMLSGGDEPALLIGEAGLTDTFRAAGISSTDDPAAAGSVVVGLDRGISYERIRRAAHAVVLGARFIGTNPDPTFPTTGIADPGAGSIIAAVARAGGRDPEFAGKPHAPMLRCVSALLGPGRTWVVGDRPETDLALGAAAGWETVLVLTGVTSDPAGAVPRPMHTLETVADLDRLILQA